MVDCRSRSWVVERCNAEHVHLDVLEDIGSINILDQEESFGDGVVCDNIVERSILK